MKQTVFLSLLLLTGTQLLYAQAGRIQPPCPQGYHAAGATYTIDQFNFHKPRTDCQSGFGLCIRGHWTVNCVSDFAYRTKVQDGKVDVWYTVKGNQLELHLPIALKDLPGFVGEDLSQFEIEASAFSLKKQSGETIAGLKGGVYRVEETKEDLVILIDLL